MTTAPPDACTCAECGGNPATRAPYPQEGIAAVTTTTDIARTHGHTGPTTCQDCGTTDNLHVVLWADPKTGESGTYLQCCGCGITAGDPPYVHDGCEPDEPEDDEPNPGPTVHVRHNPAGWVMRDYTDLEACTTNHIHGNTGQLPCTAAAVWRVVEDHGMHLTLSFWCDPHLPAEHRDTTAA